MTSDEKLGFTVGAMVVSVIVGAIYPDEVWLMVGLAGGIFMGGLIGWWIAASLRAKKVRVKESFALRKEEDTEVP